MSELRSGLYGIVGDSDHAPRAARSMERQQNSPKGARLETGDDIQEPKYKIYVYNILELDHVIEQPPAFPHFVIKAKEHGERFSVTTLPAFVKERYERPGTTEYFYKRIDGRKYATSLLNPAAYPGTLWEAQLQNWASTDQFGNNRNALGCFWSLREPNDPGLEEEIRKFSAYATRTMNELVKRAELLYASGKQAEITPLQHFAMDYLHKQAPWHMQSDRMVDCPTCGEPVKEGIAYHRNSFGDKCPVDYAKCRELGIIPALVETVQAHVAAPVAVDEDEQQAAPPMAAEEDPEAELEKAAVSGAGKEVSNLTKGAKPKPRSR